MGDLQDRLSREIFSRRYVDLDDECQRAFVDYHAEGYQRYVKKTAPIVREALRRNLRKEYDTILDMYCQRLPPEYFLAAIQEGVKKATDRECITYAASWFNDHFRRHIERYRKHVSEHVTGRIAVDVDYPWFFNIFRYTRENDTEFIFDPFWGFREKKKRKKSPGEILREAQLELEKNAQMIKSLQNSLNRMNLDKSTKDRFNKRLKWQKRKFKKNKKRYEMLEQLILLEEEWN